MATQFSTTVRNARLDAIETAVGTAAILRIRSGAAPANCGAADSGTVLAEMTLPSDWAAAASGGSKALSGSWATTGAAAGTAAHYRIYESTGATCHIQGTVSASGGGGDMIISNTSIAVGQAVSVTTYTLTDGNA